MDYTNVLTVLEFCKAVCLLLCFGIGVYAAWKADKLLAQRDYYKEKFHQASKQHLRDIERDDDER